MTDKDSGFLVPYSVRDSPGKGRGIFANAVIPKGTIVWRHVPGLYAVYDERSYTQHLQSLSHDDAVYTLTHCYGLPEFPGYMIRVFDEGELINHAAEPTVAVNKGGGTQTTEQVTSAREVEAALLDARFSLIAIRDMQAGDEMTHDYGSDVEDPSYYDLLCKQYNVNWDWV